MRIDPHRSGTRYIGSPIPRREDERLITGKGCYTNDFQVEGACWAYVLRSPYPHARINLIDVETAKGRAGVLAVLTAAEYDADGLRPIPHNANAPHALQALQPSFVNGPKEFVFENPQPVLATDRVRYVGEAVAVVVAETLDQAKDGAEAIVVDYDPLPAVTTISEAVEEGAPLLWPSAPGNVSLRAAFGDLAATEHAFAGAALTLRQAFPNQRIVNCQMEPRASIGMYDDEAGLHTLISGSQGVVRQHVALSAALAVASDKVRVISPDVGGGFGPRTPLYPESILVVWAARRLRRPVRWNSDRSEAFLTDFQGRDITLTTEAAFDARGRLQAMRLQIDGNLGAHPASFGPLANCYRLVTTVYDVRACYVELRGILTNSTPTVPYRGAGRPEATLAIERLLDLAAERLGVDRVDIRRRNLVAKSSLPYRNAMGLTYDSGDFEGNMDKALHRSDWNGFAARRCLSAEQGRLRGIGIANYVEAPVGAARERVILTITPDGEVRLVVGTQSSGQGHETVFSQVIADRLGIPLDVVRIVTGDTDVVKVGGGSHSARSMRLVGTLLVQACDSLVAKARALAAVHFDVPEHEIELSDGLFKVASSNASLSFFDLAMTETPSALSVMAELEHRIPAHPTGCAVCELEIDPETGTVELTRYTSVDDVGTPINPLIVDGQVHGGIAQGLGQALYEGAVFDGSGQVVTGSFMDYGMPRADGVPSFDVELTEDPTAGNPLGVKGGGEGGITPATAVVVNAIVNALREYGIEHIEMPATPQRIWSAIHCRADKASACPPTNSIALR